MADAAAMRDRDMVNHSRMDPVAGMLWLAHHLELITTAGMEIVEVTGADVRDQVADGMGHPGINYLNNFDIVQAVESSYDLTLTLYK